MICVSYGNNDYSEFLNLLIKYELLELRLDRCAFSVQQICDAVKLKSDIIFSYSCNELNEDRIEFLHSLIDAGASFIDAGFNPEKEDWVALIEYAKSKGCRVIISYHNFRETLSFDELLSILKRSCSYKPDFVKIACMANSEEDCANILSLYKETKILLTGKAKLVAISMGEMGKINRIAPLFLGAPFTYCSYSKGAETAEGQFDINTMQKIINLIKNG